MNNPFDALMNEDMQLYLRGLIANVIESVDVKATPKDYWVVYGSVVVNNLKPESDIDLLYVSHDDSVVTHRVQGSYEGRPVTIYVVTDKTLVDDGAQYLYGGYFTGKLFSPHVVLGVAKKDKLQIQKITHSNVGNFLANFMQHSQMNPIDALNTYLSLCPWYEAYILKFFSSSIDDELLADSLVRHYQACLNEITDHSTISNNDNAKVVSLRKIRAISRFWSFGAIEHENNHLFADYYFDKSEESILKLDPSKDRFKSIMQIIEKASAKL